ncbi:MAG: arginase family protein [Trebonia sp.]|uniref:arginase family protein n=1 Tax=Trebonia sp. TaxID=2767075 RepID=UPI003C74FED9
MDASRTPRFAGPPTFALLPRRDEVSRCDVAVVGVPFDNSMHIGIRGPLYAPTDLTEDAGLGFKIVTAMDVGRMGVDDVAAAIRERVGDNPLYLSIDIDVLDPAHAPGTGTPEAGGLTSRELLGILRGLAGLRLVGADVVEVAPAYDHAEVTTVAAAHVCYELLGLMALG